MIWFVRLSLLVAALSLLPRIDAQCFGQQEQTCYNNRATCHWVAPSTCTNGAPTNCAQYMWDQWGCYISSFNCNNMPNNGYLCGNACATLTAQQCVGSVPVRSECRYGFTNSSCYYMDTRAQCLSQPNAGVCNSTNCLFDPYINNCFDAMWQVNQVFPCSYWTSSTPCNYHGCLWINNAACVSVVTSANTLDNSTTINYAQKVTYTNPTVVTNTQRLRVTINVPFGVSSRPSMPWPQSPSWPQILILKPVDRVANYITGMSSNCSMRPQMTGPPVYAANSSTTPVQLLTSILKWVTTNKNLTFNASDPLGVLSKPVYGDPYIKSSALVTQVAMSFDSNFLVYTLDYDLPSLVAYCGSYGASVSIGATSKTYTIPVSFVEWSPQDVYTQFIQYLYVTIQNAGGFSIVSSSTFLQQAYPDQVTYPRTGCPTDAAKIQISWILRLSGVYDSSREVGPRSIADIVLKTPANNNSLGNCYGDQLVSFEELGCDSNSYSCSYRITTLSRCRALTADGEAFNDCSYSNSSDTVLDLGVNKTYSTALNTLHRFYAYIYNCPRIRSNDIQCTLVVNNASMYPDEVQAYIRASEYITQTQNVNPFNVTAGFLYRPAATLSNLSIPINSTVTFDGNVYAEQAVTAVIVLPQEIRTLYDLRLNNASTQFVIEALNVLGQPMSTGEAPVIRLNYSDIRPGLLYSAKSDYYSSGCSTTQSCQLLPACVGVLGCDGLSMPVTYLRKLMPANGYRFTVQYNLQLPAIASRRRLLQTQTFYNLDHDSGFVSVDILFITVQTNTSDNETLRRHFYDEIYQLNYEQRKRISQTVLRVNLPIIVFTIFAYFVLSACVGRSDSRRFD